MWTVDIFGEQIVRELSFSNVQVFYHLQFYNEHVAEPASVSSLSKQDGHELVA